MSFVRTVLGDIPSPELGVCYAHEHIVIDRSYVTECNPEFLLADLSKLTEEVMEFYTKGGRALVDSMPCGGGRNVEKLAAISQSTGVSILCPTGLHLQKYYAHGHWAERATSEQIAELFVAEIRDGIDRNDTLGPVLDRTEHRAGLIKVATSLDGATSHEKKIIAAAAEAHRLTGAPILTHTEEGTAGLEQIRLMTELGVRTNKIVLSHLDRRPDLPYHREILASGAFVEYDSAFRWKTTANPTRDLIEALFADGFGGQIMLGMDAARSTYWHSFGGAPGLTYLLTTFTASLISRGLTTDDLKQIFVDNPARAYAFRQGP